MGLIILFRKLSYQEENSQAEFWFESNRDRASDNDNMTILKEFLSSQKEDIEFTLTNFALSLKTWPCYLMNSLVILASKALPS